MEEYCSIHTTCKIVYPNSSRGLMFVGGYCPKCREEKTRNDLVVKQHESDRLQKEMFEDRRRWEKEEEQESQYLRAGLLEFDTEFQEEWASVVGLRDSYSEAWEEATRITRDLVSEFASRLRAGELPEEHIQSAGEKFSIGSIQKALEGIESDVFRYSYNRVQRLNVAGGIPRLYWSLQVYLEEDAFLEQELPASGKYLMMTGVFCLLMGITCNSLCDSSLDPNRSSFASAVFIWPAILFTFAFFLKFIRRRKVDSRNKKVRDTLHQFADVLTEYILGREPGKGVSPKAVFRTSTDKIYSFLKKKYMRWAFENPGKSGQGRKLHTLVCVETSCETTGELKDVYDQVENEYKYMRDTVREVGLEIHEGTRVPARMKAKKIELLRCPSCGGPLADDGKKECYYCGSKFRMI